MSTPWRLLLTVAAIGLSIFTVVEKPPQLGLDLEGGTQVVLDLSPRPGQQIDSRTANATLEVLRNRVDALGVTEPSLELSGNRRIIVELPGVTDPQRAVQVIGTTAQLTFHRVEADRGQAPPATPPTSAPQAGAAPNPDIAPAPGTSTPGESPQATTTPPTTAASMGAPGDGTRSFGQAATDPAVAPPASPQQPSGAGNELVVPDEDGRLLQLGPERLTGEGVADATAQPPDVDNPGWWLSVRFNDKGSSSWRQLTGEAACAPAGDVTSRVAIVLDNKVISSPSVGGGGPNPVQCGQGISGDTRITGDFTPAEARNLSLLIRGGALPVDVKVASQQTIGPELGDQAVEASLNAVVIGGILTMLYVLWYYRFLGLLAAIALGSYGLISYAVLLGVGLTLTLPGIAGFVLAIAMAMDSNVLVYERTKEEYANGKSLKAAGRTGFKAALSAIIDSNATTFIAALTLYFLAIGEVRGFGVTLLIGTAVSIFVTLVVLRTLTTGLLSMNWAHDRPKLLGMFVFEKFRKRMNENPPNLRKANRFFLILAALVTIVALAGVGVRGINYGIEFTGGRLLEYSTQRTVDPDTVRSAMDRLGFPNATVQRSGTDDISIRVETLSPEQLASVDNEMRQLGGAADRLRDETIGGSFSSELKRKAIIGLFVGVGLQLLWVAYRFRWTFGVGAVVAMVHDALVVLGLFAWFQKPFDAVFLAAILTIIAFSVNDSVVVFDRIREQRRRRGGDPFDEVVNDACAQTFARTINISVSALFILFTLYFFGGQTLGDFALALIVGIVAGVYSSVFVASPIAVFLEKLSPATGGRMAGRPVRGAKGDKAPKMRNQDEGDEDEDRPRTVANKPVPRPRKKSGKRR